MTTLVAGMFLEVRVPLGCCHSFPDLADGSSRDILVPSYHNGPNVLQQWLQWRSIHVGCFESHKLWPNVPIEYFLQQGHWFMGHVFR